MTIPKAANAKPGKNAYRFNWTTPAVNVNLNSPVLPPTMSKYPRMTHKADSANAPDGGRQADVDWRGHVVEPPCALIFLVIFSACHALWP